MQIIKILYVFLFLAPAWNTCRVNAQPVSAPGEKMTLLFIGDIMGHDEQLWSAQDLKTNTWNFDSVFRYIKPVISEADIAIGNLEVTLAGPPYKGYPRFSSPATMALACKNAGIDVLVTSNNHSADLGKKGITGTINRLDSLGILHTGSFANQASRDTLSPLILRKGDISVALLNYTFSTNGMSVPSPTIVNMMDKTSISNDILKAKEQDAGMIIVFLHWGREYDTVPDITQTDMASFLFSKGVDIIIGSHPHVVQKMVWYKDISENPGLVAYSLGNFVSNQYKPGTEGGAMLRIELARNNSSVVIADAGYYLTWVYKPIIRYRKRFFILPCAEFENNPRFFINQDYYVRMKKFVSGSRKLFNEQNMNINEILFKGNAWLLND